MGSRRRGRNRWAMAAVAAAILIGGTAAPLAAAPEASAALAPPSAFAWGDNELGQIGNGSRATVEFDSPLPVILPAAVKQVAASPDEFASAAVLATGKVEVWGSNAYGEAGPDAPNPSLSPQVISGLTGIIQVAVGGGHVLALDSDGTVWSWGNNTYGQLGNGTTSSLPYSNPSPVPVPGINGIVQIAAGGGFSLALRGDGTVYAWGLNSSGQLGDGTTVSRDAPEALPALAGEVAKLIAGDQTSYAIRPDGMLLSWGSNSGGLLGRGPTPGFPATPAVVPGLTGVTQVASSAAATLAVASPAAAMWAWGPNSGGESGDGTTTARATPEQTSLSGVARVAVGGLMGAAALSTGTLMTWGENQDGQLGQGSHDASVHATPAPVRTLAGVSQVALSYFSGLAVGSPAPRIPSLIGQSQADAAQTLQAAGFVLGRVSTVVDITCEYLGEIKSQSPAAGTLDPPGTAVAVAIGKAGGKCL
jgi:alpha-tubulin suppressor-like RCC1 family protein